MLPPSSPAWSGEGQAREGGAQGYGRTGCRQSSRQGAAEWVRGWKTQNRVLEGEGWPEKGLSRGHRAAFSLRAREATLGLKQGVTIPDLHF